MSKVVLLDTTYNYSYEDYVENCEANDVKVQGENSEDFYRFQQEQRELTIEDFKYEMDNFRVGKFVVTGTLGRWDGRHQIVPCFFDNARKAVEQCFDGMDEARVTFEDGVLLVDGYHHDGVHHFTVRLLSDVGEEAYENDSFDEDVKENFKPIEYTL